LSCLQLQQSSDRTLATRHTKEFNVNGKTVSRWIGCLGIVEYDNVENLIHYKSSDDGWWSKKHNVLFILYLIDLLNQKILYVALSDDL